MATVTVPALTTVFTPAASCLTDIYNLTTTSGGTPWIYLQLGPTPTANDCYPSDFTPTPAAYYSPGICPSGYQMACSSIVNINTISEIRAICCPSAYTCQDATDNGWPWYSTELCTLAATTTGTFLVTAEPSITSTYIGTPKFNAYGLQIRWQLPTKTSSSSTSTSMPSLSSQSNANTPTPTSTSTNTRFSIGTKAGIGVGVGVGIIFIFIGVVLTYFYCRRNRGDNSRATMILGQKLPEPNLYKRFELGDTQLRNGPVELDSKILTMEIG
ncbi:hypothetical protein BGW36DRAFT_383001 [Talaromyces proteolyticus]|uniref:Mid2 domain-containing protein n=1 Tax=Talaromyces proteolyticus TaxID=1131652 RepID=A0AAD4KSJ7_9EURO|nr:uncharacterized protein BGW36DRAFT_383001 [Talaromyces proteolyticus]KAH8695597.1 hypothetical protein BGW36DRAFT_383001 [Talaromyces proteolyticus]